jgi:hypothetical protein
MVGKLKVFFYFQWSGSIYSICALIKKAVELSEISVNYFADMGPLKKRFFLLKGLSYEIDFENVDES